MQPRRTVGEEKDVRVGAHRKRIEELLPHVLAVGALLPAGQNWQGKVRCDGWRAWRGMRISRGSPLDNSGANLSKLTVC